MTKNVSLSIVAGLALALACTGASAQSKARPAPAPAPAASAGSGGIGAGNSELNFFANMSDSDTGTLLLLGVGIGQYLTDNLEMKLTQQMVWFDGGGVTLYNYSPYGSVEYNFKPSPDSPFVGFAGAGLGLSLGSLDTGALGGEFFTFSLYATPVAGFKYFLNERMSLTYTLNYQFPLVEEICGDVDCFDAETTTLNNVLGFSVYY